MFEDSGLSRRDVLVLRATAPADAQFSVLDEMGREIGRVAAEGGLVQKKSARFVLYDHQHMPVLVAEHFKRHAARGGARLHHRAGRRHVQKPAWMLKGIPKLGQAWPGSANGTERR